MEIVLLRRKVDMMGKTFSSSFVSDCSYSYRKENYDQCFAIKKSSSAVKDANCTCIGGKGGWCNHVYALIRSLPYFLWKNRSTFLSF